MTPDLLRPLLDPLVLVMTANSAAWAAGRLLGTRCAAPLDFGRVQADGARLLGSHKTWRGLLAAALATGLAALLLQRGFALGSAFGALALAGDAASSYVKRRLRLAPGSEVPGLDQLPEALLPLLILQRPLGLGVPGCLLVAAVFGVFDIAVQRLRHR